MASGQALELFEGENADLEEEARDVLGDDAQWWLATGNSLFGGATPLDFIKSEDSTRQNLVRTVLRQIKYGIFS